MFLIVVSFVNSEYNSNESLHPVEKIYFFKVWNQKAADLYEKLSNETDQCDPMDGAPSVNVFYIDHEYSSDGEAEEINDPLKIIVVKT